MSGLPPSVRPPTSKQVERLAAKHHLTLDKDEVEQFRAGIEQTLEVHEWLDRVHPKRPPREYTDRDPGYKPRADEDPLNAYVTKCEVRGADSGPLSEYTVGLKDNISVAGIEMTAGTKVLEGFVPSSDAAIVTSILDAGGTITAKLNMTEFGVSHLSATGPVRNPLDENYHAGSSSAGPAAAVVEGDVDVAVGTDGGGSIRVPAAWSGCVGHCPTAGLVPADGVIGSDVGTLSRVGPMAQTVRRCAETLEVIADDDPHQSPASAKRYTAELDEGVGDLSVGVVTEGFRDCDEEIESSVRDAIDRFEELGADVTEVSIPWHTDAWYVQVAIMIEETAAKMRDNYVGRYEKSRYDVQLADTVGSARRTRGDDFPTRLKFALIAGQYLADQYNSRYYAKAQNLRTEVRQAYNDVLETVDLLAMPTTPQTADEITDDDDRIDQQSLKPVMYSNTKPFNATGHPATSVPCGRADGLPIGLMLVGKRFRDSVPLRAAHAYQRAFDDSEN